MGQQHSDLSHLPNVNYQPECEVLEKTHDSHYGEIKVVRDVRSSEKMVVKEIVANSKEAFEKEAGGFLKRTNTRHPNIVEVLGFNYKEKHKFCSTYFKISIYIEDISQTLLDQLESRKATGISFNDNEILFIADSILNALGHLHSQGLYHGDVRPFNVLTKERVYKLSDPILNAEKGTTGLSLAILHNIKTFLAPELLGQVPQRRFDISCNPYKADIFSLGATLLGLATLTDSEDFYQHHYGALKTNILNERLETVRLTYSEFTYDLIRNMLAINADSRPDLQGLLNKLLPYKDQIRVGYMNPGTPLGDFNTSAPVEFTFAGIKTESELVKRSARVPVDDGIEKHHMESQRTYQDTVVDHHAPATDDLDARIRAALERSQATFKSFKVEDSSKHYASAPYMGVMIESYYPARLHNEKITEIGTHKEAELTKSKTPHDLAKPYTSAQPNYLSSTSHYPSATTHQYTTAQPHVASYSAYTPSYDVNLGTSNSETERLLKSSVVKDLKYHSTDANITNPLQTHLIGSTQLYPNTHSMNYGSTHVYGGSYVPPTTTTTYTAPYVHHTTSTIHADEPTDVATRVQAERALKSSVVRPGESTNTYPLTTLNYGTTTTYTPNTGLAGSHVYANRLSGSQVQNSAGAHNAANIAAGESTNVHEIHGVSGFTEQLNRLGLGDKTYQAVHY